MNKSYQEVAKSGDYGYIVDTLILPIVAGSTLATLIGCIFIKLF